MERRRPLEALTLALLAACSSAPDAPPAPLRAELHDARIEFQDGRPPWFDAERLPVVRHAGDAVTTLELTCGDARLDAAVHRVLVDGATVLRVERTDPCLGEGAIMLRHDGRHVARWPVRWQPLPRLTPAAAELRRLRAAGQVAEALSHRPRAPTEADRIWLPTEIADTHFRRGDLPTALAAWIEAAQHPAVAQAPSERASRLSIAAFIALRMKDFARAEGLLANTEAALNQRPAPRMSALLHYYRARLAIELGRFRAAGRAAGAGRAAAARIAAHDLGFFLTELEADMAARVGRHGDAIGQLLESTPRPRDLARHLNNVGWLLIQNAEVESAAPLLEAALGLARAQGLGPLEANVLTNISWAAFWRGDLPAATAALAEADAANGDRIAGSLADQIRAELALARGELSTAARLFADAERRARGEVADGDCDACWRARFGQCRARRAAGDPGGARQDCLGALDEVERLSTGAGLLDGRAEFFASRGALLAEALDLLLAEGDADAAFTIADDARARILRAMQARIRLDGLGPEASAAWGAELTRFRRARAAWARHLANEDLVVDRPRWRARRAELRAAHDAALAAAFERLDELAPLTAPAGAEGRALRRRLGPDEALIALTWTGRRWLRFWVTHEATRWDLVDAPLAQRGARLAGVAHLYVVPGGHPAALTVHADPTVAASVSYLPYAGLLLRPPPRGHGALLIADSRSDLPHTRAAAEGLRSTLEATALIGKAARRDAVLPELSGRRLIHFAGHGVLRPDDPWAAHLALAGGERLALPDVLVRRLEAALVVLSGCETGPAAVLLRDDAVGLPEAFLAAGAMRVIASDRVVPDAATTRFFQRFYALGGRRRPAEALRDATRALAAEGESVGAVFRLIGAR